MYEIKSFLEKGKKKFIALFAAAFTALSMAVCACAADSTDSPTALAGASDQIIDQFSGAANDIIPIILGVLGAGLVIFVVFVGIRLAKKMFSTVAK